jgi:hypothetical protein
MKTRWGVLSLSLILSSAIATPARATIVRARTVGMEALLPDEEQDLDVAGAFVYDFQSPRLFTTLGVRRDRTATSLAPGVENTSSALGVSSVFRYVGALGPLPFALRYAPNYIEERSRDLTSHIYTRSRADVGLVLGLGGGRLWKLAIEPFYRDLYTHSSSSFNTGERHEDEYGVKGSLLWGEKGSFRAAVSLESGRVRNKHTNPLTGQTAVDIRDWSHGLSVVPELPLWGGMSRFLLRATSHRSDSDVLTASTHEGVSDLVLDAGVGLTVPAGAEGLWHTSFLFSRTDADRKYIDLATPLNIQLDSLRQTGIWRLGTEKTIVPGVTQMVSVDLLSFVDSRSTSNNFRSEATDLDWYAGVTVGLGLQPTDSLRIDFNFASVTSTSSDLHARGLGTTLDSKEKVFSAEFEVDYRF